VVEVVAETAAGRVPVFGDVQATRLIGAVDKAKKLARVKGLTGILTANTLLHKPGQKGRPALPRDPEASTCPCCCTTSRRTGVNLGSNGAASGRDS